MTHVRPDGVQREGDIETMKIYKLPLVQRVYLNERGLRRLEWKEKGLIISLHELWNTPEWKRCVQIRLGRECVLCGKRKTLVLHHRNNDIDIVEEYLGTYEVATLCMTCHKCYHYGLRNWSLKR